MLILVLGGVALFIFLYFWAIKVVASRIRWNFEVGELVNFDQELKGRYLDHVTKMAILAMFSNGTLEIHGFSGDVSQAVRRVFQEGSFSFKRIRKIRNQR